MPEIVSVGMGEGHVRKSSDAVLVALGLGSCVAVCFYDPVILVGAMAHVMLPAAVRDANAPFRFADSAVPALLAAIEQGGGLRSRLQVALAGGAQMFSTAAGQSALDIGSRNVAAVRQAISALGLPVVAEDVGGNLGRSVYLHVVSGRVVVRTIGKPERDLAVLGKARAARPPGGAGASVSATLGATR